MIDPRDIRPCSRCGILRPARKRTLMCRDCRSVLTKQEKELWAA